MTGIFTRRELLATAGVATAAALSLSAREVRAAPSEIPVRWAATIPGFTALSVHFILANGLGKKHGLNLLEPASYSSMSTYYNDFAAGNYDVCIGSWDTFAARYQAGVPIKYVCTVTNANMISIIAPKASITDVVQLKGKTIAALQSTGTYRMVRALIKEALKFDIEKDASIQNVDNAAAPVTLLMANRADAALAWEPSVTAGFLKRPDLQVILQAEELYKTISSGLELPYIGVAVRQELLDANPGIAAKISGVFRDCALGIGADTDKAVDLVGSKTGMPGDTLKAAMRSKRLALVDRPMSDERARSSVIKASEFLTRNGLLAKPVDQKFFAV